MTEKYYAHSLEGKPKSEWQSLDEHLNNVAEKARSFAKVFGAGDWAYLAGALHDEGKGSLEFQAYLRNANAIEDEFKKYFVGPVDHSSSGAQRSYTANSQGGKLLAYLVAGHHSGLLNWGQTGAHGLKYRLGKKVPSVTCHFEKKLNIPKQLPLSSLNPNRFGFQLQFFLRMIFSCLVDADFLDTERFLQPQKANNRIAHHPLQSLLDHFWENFNALRENVDKSPVNLIREQILADCLAKADSAPGLFSLTVPTGGGKTLSSMAFALKHASKYKKRRIIYVIPFTSIIEQNAAVFRTMLGPEVVLEHHTNFVPDESDWQTKLATENWNAPVVVTTNVQFFDSFFANKTSKCRKLHNIVDSVVVFDEVQAIPVEKLAPCLEVLRELTLNYGVTIVLCTATQPAFEQSSEFEMGLRNVREVISDVPALFRSLKRTQEMFIGDCDNSSMAERLCREKQVLCVVSTRQHAVDLFDLVKESGDAFHLSALMYPVHRSRKLKEIKDRLNNDLLPCRVVSTQVIEAGVDIDFPVVFRSLAGIDSIAQAAGRCNREGRKKKGQVFIYRPENEPPPGYFRQTAQCAEKLLDQFEGELIEPRCVREYFLNYYWLNQQRMDADGIGELCRAGERGDIQFEDIGAFRMIENANQPIIIAVKEEAAELVRQLEFADYTSRILRKLQQYSVQIYPFQFETLKDWLENPCPGVFVLRSPEIYSEDTGLCCHPPEGQAYFV